MRRLWPVPVAAALSLFAARPARAQTHFDASFNAGVAKRFLTGGSLNGSFGPVIGLEGDVAVVPLVRIGVYVDEEMAADGEPKAPFITSFGGRIKLLPPIGNENYRLWLFAGFGYAALSAPSYHQSVPLPNPASSSLTNADVTTPSAGGSFLELPFGIGGSYRLRAPWVVQAELSGRVAMGSNGSYFDPTGRNAYQTSNGDFLGLVIGKESVAMFFTVGIGLDL